MNDLAQVNIETGTRVFDFNGYSIFKERGNRYELLPRKLCNLIKIKFDLSDIEKIIDLGSGELTLIEETLTCLNKRFNCVSVDNSVQVLNRIQSKYEDKIGFTNFVFHDLMEYKDQIPNDSIDIFIASHVIYHIIPNRWHELIDSLKNKLRADGIIILVARSLKGEFWKAFNDIESDIEDVRLKSHIFSEDVIKELSNYNINSDQVEFSLTPLTLKELLRIVEFLYRIPQHYIKEDTPLAEKVKRLAKPYYDGSKYSIGSCDEILIIGK